MIVVDTNKCVGCGRCITFCPREALTAWGYVKVDESKCTDCFGGIYQIEERCGFHEIKTIIDQNKDVWTRLCVENCPVNALSAVNNPVTGG